MSSTPAVVPPAATYMIEPAHSSAHFKVRHLMIANVRGEFSQEYAAAGARCRGTVLQIVGDGGADRLGQRTGLSLEP